MIKRVLLAAILAGLAAGFVMAVIQHVRLTPLIIHAETFEGKEAQAAVVAEPHDDTGTATHSHDAEAWAPADGWERTLYTTATAMLAAVGFALVLTGVSFLSGTAITPTNGLIWGLCGFLALSFAPAVGLPPELPGMQGAELAARQIWWGGTAICTGLGLWLIAMRRSWQNQVAAVVLLAMPHVIGAPQPAAHNSAVPPSLAAEFATASLGANFVMWALIGLFLSIALARFEAMEKT